MSWRRAAPWAWAFGVVGVAAFAIGIATAPEAEDAGAASVIDRPHGLALPKLGAVAPLPQMRVEPVAEEGFEGSESGVSETAPSIETETFVEPEAEAPAPEPAPTPEPEPTAPEPSGGGEDLQPET